MLTSSRKTIDMNVRTCASAAHGLVAREQGFVEIEQEVLRSVLCLRDAFGIVCMLC